MRDAAVVLIGNHQQTLISKGGESSQNRVVNFRVAASLLKIKIKLLTKSKGVISFCLISMHSVACA